MALPEVDGAGGSSSSTASASSSSNFPRNEEPPRGARAPHEVGGPPVEYRLVIPTRGRWRPASEISTERASKRDFRPFILVKTLAFLKRQRIPPRRVSLYLADEAEKEKYEHALLEDPYWAGVHLEVGVPGVMGQRNHIVRTRPEGEYIVSFDDDISDIHWKSHAGSLDLASLPDGVLEQLIFHAYSLMRRHNAFIWGLNATVNARCMWTDGVSTRNGEINGFCYGFINRHSPDLQPQVADATEDAERSLRYFKKDQMVLRYRMYAGVTRCFKFAHGLQSLFEGSSLSQKNDARKVAEREAARKLMDMFPKQTGQSKQRKTVSTLEVSFRHIGGFPLPVTTADHLLKANRLDDAAKNPAKTSDDPGGVNADEHGAARKSKRQKKCSIELGSAAAGKKQASLSEWLPPTPQAPPRGAPAYIRADVGVESSGESNQSEDEQEGSDENKQFESLAASMSCGGEEDIQRALKESLKDVVLLFNGTAADPIETALKQSLELDAEENSRKREEAENLERVLRISSLDAGEEEDQFAKAVRWTAVQRRERNTLPDFDAKLGSLLEMGFENALAAKVLSKTEGNLAAAISELLGS
eukprot:TRINITY_DN106484_c0_g1_i1.p1 TRINITY_DN106484_c0_g1~~TRINITY_DN106484_c0_g1_i1.p1  ORF type:complete len:599 (+),score=129.22 TRINITY_DN106484_c0_g1_i1:37-1797(+)